MTAGERHHFSEIKIADRCRAFCRTADRARNGTGHERCDD
jgi:hypothetical protein